MTTEVSLRIRRKIQPSPKQMFRVQFFNIRRRSNKQFVILKLFLSSHRWIINFCIFVSYQRMLWIWNYSLKEVSWLENIQFEWKVLIGWSSLGLHTEDELTKPFTTLHIIQQVKLNIRICKVTFDSNHLTICWHKFPKFLNAEFSNEGWKN